MSITLELAPSTTLRYTESRAYIRHLQTPTTPTQWSASWVTREYKINDQRWYFRGEGEDRLALGSSTRSLSSR